MTDVTQSLQPKDSIKLTSNLPHEGDPTDHITTAVDANPIAVHIDDDGLALDDYFEDMPSSPIPRDYLSTGDTVNVPVTTRILVSKFVSSPSLGGATQALLFPADPNRQTLFISCTVAARFNVTSEPLGAVGGVGAFAGGPLISAQEIIGHTGAVWITHDAVADTVFYVTSVTV